MRRNAQHMCVLHLVYSTNKGSNNSFTPAFLCEVWSMLYLLYSCLRKVLFVYPAGLFFWETIPPDQELLFSLLQAKKLGREAPPKQDSDLWVGLGLRMPAHFNLLCQMPLSVSYYTFFLCQITLSTR